MLYLLHFNPRYRHAGHYLGYTQDVLQRFAFHLRGRGSPLVSAAVTNGCQILLVIIWNEDGNAEQEIKRIVGSRARLCPICNPKAANVLKVYKSVFVRLTTAEQVAHALKSVVEEENA